MRTVLVVAREVLDQDLLEMAPTEDEEPIEALSADGPDEALRERVRSRTSNLRLDGPETLCAENFVEAGGELRVSVSDEELG